MKYKNQRDIMNEAINLGCKTMAELALYIKLRAKLNLL